MAGTLKEKITAAVAGGGNNDRLVKAARTVGGSLGRAEGKAIKARKSVESGVRDVKQAVAKKVSAAKAAKRQAGKLVREVAGDARALVRDAKKAGRKLGRGAKQVARRLTS